MQRPPHCVRRWLADLCGHRSRRPTTAPTSARQDRPRLFAAKCAGRPDPRLDATSRPDVPGRNVGQVCAKGWPFFGLRSRHGLAATEAGRARKPRRSWQVARVVPGGAPPRPMSPPVPTRMLPSPNRAAVAARVADTPYYLGLSAFQQTACSRSLLAPNTLKVALPKHLKFKQIPLIFAVMPKRPAVRLWIWTVPRCACVPFHRRSIENRKLRRRT